jgi:hypothetical protein
MVFNLYPIRDVPLDPDEFVVDDTTGVEYTIRNSDDDRRKGTAKIRRLSPL